MFVPGSMGRPAYRLYRLAWAGLDWLYPPLCGGCDKLGLRWCTDCQRGVQLIPDRVCQCCGRALDPAGVCTDCQASLPPYAALRSWAEFEGPLRNALHRLKYKGDLALGEVLARPLINMLSSLKWPVDLVTPVPIGIARRTERGYNQAALLAMPIALSQGITYQSQALTKVRETRSQVGLTAVQRLENVKEAFQAQARFVSGKNVLIVDDVATSGATLLACTMALLAADARQVFGLTLARAV